MSSLKNRLCISIYTLGTILWGVASDAAILRNMLAPALICMGISLLCLMVTFWSIGQGMINDAD